MYRIACLLAVAATLVLGGAARASDPIGAYVIVDKVVLEPADAPTTIQVWGTVSLALAKPGDSYSEPLCGYLYYKAPSGKEDVCRKEWNDLKKAAGTGQVIGFGSRYDRKALGKVRKASEKPEAPDTYPLADGLVKVAEDLNYAPIRTLRTVPAPQTPADGAVVPPDNVTLVIRNMVDKTHAKAKYVFELVPESGIKEEGTVAAGDKETKWTPKMKLKAGEKYVWRVWATEGKWKGSVATSSFVVKGEK